MYTTSGTRTSKCFYSSTETITYTTSATTTVRTAWFNSSATSYVVSTPRTYDC